MGYRCQITWKHNTGKPIRITSSTRPAEYLDGAGKKIGAGHEVAGELSLSLDGLREYVQRTGLERDLLDRLTAPLPERPATFQPVKLERAGKSAKTIEASLAESKDEIAEVNADWDVTSGDGL